MYGPNELRQVKALWADGWSQQRIAREVGLARATVRSWLSDEPPAWTLPTSPTSHEQCPPCPLRERVRFFADQYSYLLGQYLGDGCISPMKNAFRLRISCCAFYPGIVNECVEAMSYVRGRLALTQGPDAGVIEVSAYSKHWPCLFPQHGPGRKHERRIRLWLWQRELVERHPEALLRGLIHSDGCRYVNAVTTRGKRYAYPTYSFSNRSGDIQAIFRGACDLVGVEWRQSNPWTTTISRRPSVAVLDRFVGPKG